MVNISTENVLIEQNNFSSGHGIAIGKNVADYVYSRRISRVTLELTCSIVQNNIGYVKAVGRVFLIQ